MVTRIQLSGKQVARINLRPDIYRKAGAQLMGKELVGGEPQLKAVKKALKEWIDSSGEVLLEMDIQPIIDEIDEALS